MRATDLENLIQRLNGEMFRESFAQDLEKGKAGKWFDEIPGNNGLLRVEPSHFGKPLRDELRALITNDAGKHQAIGHVIDEKQMEQSPLSSSWLVSTTTSFRLG